jgi:DNA/RNA endonuclease YhcR with UshA esterase domain
MATDQRVSTLAGKIVSIIGTIELSQGKPEIKVTSADQVKAKFSTGD